MTEKETIKALQSLRSIRPEKSWLLATKNRVIGPGFEYKELIFKDILLFFSQKWVLAPAAAFSLFFGAFGISQNSLPGDVLYPMKRVSEDLTSYLSKQEEKSLVYLGLTDKRIDELQKIADTNQAKKLAIALNELETSKKAVKKETAGLKTMDSQEASKIALEVAAKMVEINQKEGKVLADLGIEQEQGADPAEKEVADLLIKEAEKTTLTEKQAIFLNEAKEAFALADYQSALEKMLDLSYLRE
jgi:hypothetical protein